MSAVQNLLSLDEGIDPAFWHPPILDQPSAWFGHIPFANWIAATMRPDLLVELGTYTGVSYAAFCNVVSRLGLATRCYAIDTWRGDTLTGHYDDNIYQTFSRFNEARFAAFSTLLRSTFDDALPNFADGSIDLLHIDGFHSYEAVQHDFETWKPKLSSRGIVLFHDTNEHGEGFGVWKYWSELKEQYPTFEFLHSHGLGVLCYGKDASEAVRSLCDLDDEAATRLRSHFQTIGERWTAEFLLAARDRELREIKSRLQQSDNLLREKEESTRHLLASIQSMLDRVNTLQDRVVERDERIAAIYRSTSWKVTAPMRSLVRATHAKPSPQPSEAFEKYP